MNPLHELNVMAIVATFAISAAIIVIYAGASIWVGLLVTIACMVMGFQYWELEKRK